MKKTQVKPFVEHKPHVVRFWLAWRKIVSQQVIDGDVSVDMCLDFAQAYAEYRMVAQALGE